MSALVATIFVDFPKNFLHTISITICSLVCITSTNKLYNYADIGAL